MAALTNVRDTSELGGKYIALPVKGATTIYQGSIVAIDATDRPRPDGKTVEDTFRPLHEEGVLLMVDSAT